MQYDSLWCLLTFSDSILPASSSRFAVYFPHLVHFHMGNGVVKNTSYIFSLTDRVGAQTPPSRPNTPGANKFIIQPGQPRPPLFITVSLTLNSKKYGFKNYDTLRQLINYFICSRYVILQL